MPAAADINDGPEERVRSLYPHVRLPDVLTESEWKRLVGALQLSHREADVLRCAFYDERADVMATRLNLAVGTVHTYRDRLYRKLGVGSIAQVIAVAFTTYVQLQSRGANR